MNNEEKDIEFIERYLEEKLSPEELADFENRLAADEKFEKDFVAYKALIGGIKYSGKNAVLQKLKKMEASISVQESFDKRKFGIPVKYLYTYSAAATVLLLITFTFVFILQDKPSTEVLFSQNFEPYPNVLAPTTRGDKKALTEKEQALYLYDLEEYNKAAPLLQQVYDQEKDPALLLYLGNSYMATGKFEESIKIFEELAKTDFKLKNQALWYLALSYLAKNDIVRAEEILEKIQAQNNSYSDKADKLLEKLD